MNDFLKKEIEKLEHFVHPGKTEPRHAAPGAEGAGEITAPVETKVPTAPTDRSATPHRTLLIHGYSATGAEFQPWKDALGGKGIDTATIEIGNYISLNNEITIKDLGEAFDRALRLTQWSGGSKDDTWTFDAIVHSTGMLVLRQWLTSDPFPRTDPRSRVKRLKHLVGLAPATFGSPQGKKGRSWLGALVKGSKDFWGPDFLNAGDLVLDGLELASKYTWDLAMSDMLCPEPMYDKGDGTPYVAVFIGNEPYQGVSSVANSPGTDGTVRWAGCALDSRIVQLDFRREPKLVGDDNKPTRAKISKWAPNRLECPIIALHKKNHGSILQHPDDGAVERVSRFLRTVTTDEGYSAWLAEAKAFGQDARDVMDKASGLGDVAGRGWQQFVFHVKDDHGDGVDDYHVQLYVGDDAVDENGDRPGAALIPLVADAYSSDNSYRCFYVRLTDDMLGAGDEGGAKKVWMELIASSGTAYLEYEAYNNEKPEDATVSRTRLTTQRGGVQAVKLDLMNLGSDSKLFYAYTTTLVEVVLEREPIPLEKVSKLFGFWQGDEKGQE